MIAKYFSPALLAAAFICIGFSLPASAQNRDDQWNRLTALASRTRLVVEQGGTKALKGRFVRATDQTLTVKAGGRELGLSRNDIAAVYRGTRSSRLKRGLIGALAGAGAGVLIGVVAVTTAKADPLIAAGGFLIGIPAGAAIGAATGGGTKKGELIYSR